MPDVEKERLRENRILAKNLDLLYKYRPFDPAYPTQFERALQMLRAGTIWMATPSSFNDPFDCQPSIIRNKETEQQDLAKILENRLDVIKKALRTHEQLADRQLQPIARRKLVELRRLLESGLPKDRKYQVLKKYFIMPPDGDTAFNELKERLDRVGVMSLSATPTQMLMWAHYASQHKGFCLGFERSEGSLLASQSQTKPVNYLDAYPNVDLSTLPVSWSFSLGDGGISDSLEIDIYEPCLQAVIYSKATDWAYEQEWRVLVPRGASLTPYPSPLKKIIFGLRCEQNSRQLIREAVSEARAERPISFAEIESKTGSFALRVRDLETVSSTVA
jgi:hypothetical protein